MQNVSVVPMQKLATCILNQCNKLSIPHPVIYWRWSFAKKDPISKKWCGWLLVYNLPTKFFRWLCTGNRSIAHFSIGLIHHSTCCVKFSKNFQSPCQSFHISMDNCFEKIDVIISWFWCQKTHIKIYKHGSFLVKIRR